MSSARRSTRPRPQPSAEPLDEQGGVRARILDAALAILRESGIQKVSQVQVARRAKVRQSHLTYYFPKRHDLLEALSTRFIDGLTAGLRDTTRSTAGDPHALLRHLTDTIGELEHMRMFAGIIIEADGDPELRNVVIRETQRVQAVLAETLGGDDGPERARIVLAALWGTGLYGFAVRAQLNPETWDPLLACLVGAPAKTKKA